MLFRKKKRGDDSSQPFPDGWERILNENVVLFGLLSDDEKTILRDKARALVGRLHWEGCAGLEMTDEIRVTVAGQAALLLLGLGDYGFDELKTVLVYPGGFLAVHEDPLGIEDEYQRNLGESYEGGPIILSWWEARWGGRRLGEVSVVLHEFAHKLADLGDPERGKPPIMDAALEQRWDEVMGEEYEKFCVEVERGRPTLLDPYGAENLGEFFGVGTEYFFVHAAAMKRRHPDLYQLLADFYKQDPAARPVPEELRMQSKEAEQEYLRHVVAECTAALAHQPDYGEALLERAGCLRDLGDYPAAISDCDALLDLAQDDEERAGAILERGRIRRDAGDDAQAMKDFDEALRLDKRFIDAWIERGALQAERGERKPALADFSQALKLDPENADALIERAQVHRETGDLDKARRDLEKAIRLSPQQPEAFAMRASVHLDASDLDAALADCESALQLEPKDSEALKFRGIAHARKGQRVLALADLQEALRLDPEDAETREELARLS